MGAGRWNIRDGRVDDCTLYNDAVEEGLCLIRPREQVADDVCRARRFTEECHVGGITTEIRDVTVNPLHDVALIAQAVVSNPFFVV